jgi:membrane-bound lytic murein transglycosylase D
LLISTVSQNLALGQSQQPQTDNIKALMERADASFKKGEAAFHKGQKEEARRYFDESVDVIMLSGVNLRANPRLDAFYVELVERINGFEVPKAIRPDSIPVVNSNTNSYRQQQAQPAVNVEHSLIDDISNINENELSAVSSSGVRIYGKYDFDFSVAPPVLQYLSYFVSGRGRSTMETGLQRSGRYRQMAEKIFKEEGVPTDLIWLAQAESVWKPNALSHAAAKGIWQFIPGTGTRFGLMQTAYIDERSHPEKSTRAAARYLKWLHSHFAGDWLLAMAAYNSGENRIDGAIAKCGYADFWELYRQGLIPRETRNYVPIILAITIVSKNQKRYGFNVKPDPTIHYDTTNIPDQTDIRVVADLLGVPYEVIQDLNPELRRGSTPPGQAYTLRLPKGMKKSFEVAFAELPEEQRLRSSRTLIARDDTPERAKPERLERSEKADRTEKSERAERAEKPSVRIDQQALARSEKPSVRLDQTLARVQKSSFKTQIISYQVKRGDTLASVAKQHGVSTQEVAKLNRLSSRGELLKGQSIRVPANVQAPNIAKASNSKSRTYESRYATKNTSRMELKGRGKAKIEWRSKTSSKAKAKPAVVKSKSSKRRR